MAASIDEAIEFAVAVADDHQRLAEHLQREIIAGLLGLIPTADGEPILLQNVLDLPSVNYLVVVATRGDEAVQTSLPLSQDSFDFVLREGRSAIPMFRESLAHSWCQKEQTMSRLAHTHNYTVLAETQALAGEFDDALVTAEKAVELNPQERADHPEAYRVRGELRLRKGLTELAEQDFREAIVLSRKMSAKMLELRATTSLAQDQSSE
jgi:tetratricopeptide (TPR) repeat protein